MALRALVAKSGNAHARVPIGSPALDNMEGRKQRIKDGTWLTFNPSEHNLNLIRKFHPNLEIELPEGNTRRDPRRPDRAIGTYQSVVDPPCRDYQLEAREKGLKAMVLEGGFGYWHDMGLGKTRTAIDTFLTKYAQGMVTGVLIITFKGVHRQWIDQQLPLWAGTINGRKIEYDAVAMHPTLPPVFERGWTPKLEILATNFESLNSNFRSSHIKQFCDYHKSALFVVIDECHAIKNMHSSRTENCLALAEIARFRLILTGTPTAKDIEDEYVQSKMIDQKIFGFAHLKSFQVQFKNRDGSPKNLQKFQELLAPHVHRLRKEDCADLPEKLYERYVFDLKPAARKAYNELKRNFFTTFQGEDFTVQNGAVLMIRLQQICNGRLVNEDKTFKEIGLERQEALKELLPKYEQEEKVIIWSRFVSDIAPLVDICGKHGYVVTLNGKMKERERIEAARDFMENDRVKFGVFNARVGGTGWNFQGKCRTEIFYTNGFNSIERWQAEDRIHRIGTKHPCNYVDIIAHNSIDEYILKSLRDKKSLADLIAGFFKEEMTDYDDADLSAIEAKILNNSNLELEELE